MEYEIINLENCRRNLLNNKFQILPVIYSPFVLKTNEHELNYLWKSHDWKHENELRCLHFAEDNIIDFYPIKCIFITKFMKPEHRLKIYDFIKNHKSVELLEVDFYSKNNFRKIKLKEIAEVLRSCCIGYTYLENANSLIDC